jgi:ribosomal protein L29
MKASEIRDLRFQQVSGQLTDASRLRFLRRDIARMMTIAGERKAEVEGEG